MKVENMDGIANQLLISNDDGSVAFQSYNSVIAIKRNGKVTLDESKWDYSKTTGKYRNRFLREDKKATEAKIKSGEYKLANLNK
ncbi:MAG: hypothetical protein WC364_13040 [Eubacteriales bacterium]|jgi:hypothetical protein